MVVYWQTSSNTYKCEERTMQKTNRQKNKIYDFHRRLLHQLEPETFLTIE